MRSPRPAIRKADGPMSTPRRLPPRSNGTPDVLGGRSCARRIVLDGRQGAAGRLKSETYPDRAVSVRRADFQRVRGAAGSNHHLQKSAVLVRNGEQVFVGRSDLTKDR